MGSHLSNADVVLEQRQSTPLRDEHNAITSKLYDGTESVFRHSTSDISNLNIPTIADKSVPKLTLSDPKESSDKIDKPGNYSETIMVDGTPRQFLLHVPANYDPSKPMPLAVVLHGFGGDPAGAERQSGLDAEADKHGFIVAYPAAKEWDLFGLKKTAWDTGNGLMPPGEHADDVAFLRKVIDNCQSRLSVDDKRIYLSGYSNGGMEAYKAAGELSDKIAAVVDISGAMGGKEIKPASPVSVLSIVGTNDTTVPPTGRTQEEEATVVAPQVMPYLIKAHPELEDALKSQTGSDLAQTLAIQSGIVPEFKPVTYATDFFKSADDISAAGTIIKNGAITTETYTNPKNGVTVEQETVAGANHCIQKDAPPGFNLADEIWKFLEAHPKTS